MSANTLSLSPWLHPICKSQQFHLRKNWVNHFSLEFSLKAVLGHFQEDYVLLNEDKNNTGLASWGIFSCMGGIPANGEQSTIKHAKTPYKSPKILPTHNNTYICPQGAIDCVRELDQLDQVTLLSVGPPISQEPGLQPRWGLDLPSFGRHQKPRKSHWTHGFFLKAGTWKRRKQKIPRYIKYIYIYMYIYIIWNSYDKKRNFQVPAISFHAHNLCTQCLFFWNLPRVLNNIRGRGGTTTGCMTGSELVPRPGCGLPVLTVVRRERAKRSSLAVQTRRDQNMDIGCFQK